MNSEDISVADLLRQARERRGESLEQVHERTQINEKILSGLEQGDFDVVEPVYMRLAALTYAEYLGLDTDQVAESYDATSGQSFPDILGHLGALARRQVEGTRGFREPLDITQTKIGRFLTQN